MQDLKLNDSAKELSKLFSLSSLGLLSEGYVGDSVQSGLYFQIIRRKAVAYNMILYKPFFYGIDADLRRKLLFLLAEMDELAQILNYLKDNEEDKCAHRMNIFTHVRNRSTIKDEIIIRLEKVTYLIMLLSMQLQDAFSAMLMNTKLEEFVKISKVSYRCRDDEVTAVPSLLIRIQKAMENALKHLVKSQRADGEFCTYWSENTSMTSSNYVSSPFITGLILLALEKVNDKSIISMRQKALIYLKSCRKSSGFFFLSSRNGQ